ncbi:MAG TPA: NAD-dependent epimerase/dehydratase family protein [Bryobacteraceae bacterium]|nr:NAD-dependent epimerase/dehydratase family protein [Bryobacteraceae bacterium]
MKRISLVGAAGAIGESVAQALRRQGRPYRVVGRNRESLQQSFGSDPLAEVVTWNPDDTASVRAAMHDVDTLVYLVGVPYDRFELHPLLMTKTLEGACAEGVERLLLIGTVYPYGLPTTPKVSEQHPRNPHTYKGRMRKQQEDLLLEADAAGRIRGAILRLPDFYGPRVEKSYLHSLFQAAASGGTANMLGPIDTPHEFVFVPDVGDVVTGLLGKPEAYGRFWNLAGPGAITQREIINRVFAMAGRKPKFRVAGKWTLRVLGLFNPLMRELAEMNYLLTNPVLMDDTALTGLLGGIRKTPYEQGFELSLDAYRRVGTSA